MATSWLLLSKCKVSACRIFKKTKHKSIPLRDAAVVAVESAAVDDVAEAEVDVAAVEGSAAVAAEASEPLVGPLTVARFLIASKNEYLQKRSLHFLKQQHKTNR